MDVKYRDPRAAQWLGIRSASEAFEQILSNVSHPFSALFTRPHWVHAELFQLCTSIACPLSSFTQSTRLFTTRLNRIKSARKGCFIERENVVPDTICVELRRRVAISHITGAINSAIKVARGCLQTLHTSIDWILCGEWACFG